MSLILKNKTANNITILGQTISANNGTYTIPTHMEMVFAVSPVLKQYIKSSAIWLGDGVAEYADSSALELLSAMVQLKNVIGPRNYGSIENEGDYIALGISGLTTALVIVDGSWAENMLFFEVSMDGSTWLPIFGSDIYTLDGQLINSTPIAGTFSFNVAGYKFFRVNLPNGEIDGTCIVDIGGSIGAGVIWSILNFIFAKCYLKDGSGNDLSSSAIDTKRSIDVAPPFRTDEHTFTGTGNGDTVDCSTCPMSRFSLSVVKSGLITSWSVVLEGSHDGTNFSTILTHTNVTPGNGELQFTGSSQYPVTYFRTRCSDFVLGDGTNIVARAVGMP